MRLILPLLILLLTLSTVRAQDPTGTWRLDQEAFETEMTTFMESQLGSLDNLPEGQRGQMQAMIKSIVAQATADIGGEAEFQPDGRIIFTDNEGNEDTGTWTQDGDIVTVTPDDTDAGQQAIEATLAGDTMTVRPDMEDAPPGTPEMTMIFRRVN